MITRIVAILEDDSRRSDAMRIVLAGLLPDCSVQVYDRARDMCAWLSRNQGNTILICLDHDLKVVCQRDGTLDDCGTGMEVALYLAEQIPTCPVVIHTTNLPAGDGMMHVLSRWPVQRVVPYADLEWIDSDWKRAVLTFQKSGYLS